MAEGRQWTPNQIQTEGKQKKNTSNRDSINSLQMEKSNRLVKITVAFRKYFWSAFFFSSRELSSSWSSLKSQSHRQCLFWLSCDPSDWIWFRISSRSKNLWDSRPVVVRSHLAVFILGIGFLLLEELVQTGLGVLQSPVSVKVSVQIHFLRLQSLQTKTQAGGRLARERNQTWRKKKGNSFWF